MRKERRDVVRGDALCMAKPDHGDGKGSRHEGNGAAIKGQLIRASEQGHEGPGAQEVGGYENGFPN